MNEIVPLSPENCEVTKLGVIFRESMTFAQWAEIGEKLEAERESIQFWLGDWVNAGKRYGATYDEFIKNNNGAYGTGANYAWVCRKIEFSRRRELSFGHHYEIAGLETPEEQDKYFDLAIQHNWSVMDLRQAIRLDHRTYVNDEQSKPIRTFIGWISEGVTLINTRLKDRPLESWEEREITACYHELEPLLQFAEQLKEAQISRRMAA